MSEFYGRKAALDGRDIYCKECAHLRNKEWRAKNKDKYTHCRLKYRYGISLSDYDEMFVGQGGLCAICKCAGSARGLFVDHCHRTGVVRGLLCSTCNMGVGLLKDDPEILRSAALYLDDYSGGITQSCGLPH